MLRGTEGPRVWGLPGEPVGQTPQVGWGCRNSRQLEWHGREAPASRRPERVSQCHSHISIACSPRSQCAIYGGKGRKKEFRFKLLSLKRVSLHIKKLSRACGRTGLGSWGINLCVWKKDLLVNLAVFFVELAVANHYTSIYLILKEYKTMAHK